MDNNEVKIAWERAEKYAEIILSAYYLGIGILNAKKKQLLLKQWVEFMKSNNYVYNGCYDEIIALQL